MGYSCLPSRLSALFNSVYVNQYDTVLQRLSWKLVELKYKTRSINNCFGTRHHYPRNNPKKALINIHQFNNAKISNIYKYNENKMSLTQVCKLKKKHVNQKNKW